MTTRAELRFLVQVDLGIQPTGSWVLEFDAGCVVPAGAVPCSHQSVSANFNIDAAVVLGQAIAIAKDGEPTLTNLACQNAFKVALPEHEHVVVSGWETADVQ